MSGCCDSGHDHDHEHEHDSGDGRLGIRLGQLLFLAWGGTVFYLLASGHYATFLNPSLWPLMLLALLLSGAFLTALLVLPGGHAVRNEVAWVRTAVLGLPLLYVVLGFGQTLGSDALQKRSVGGLADLGDLAALGDIDDDFVPHVQNKGVMTVLQVVRRGKALEGTEVTTLGQVAREVGEPDGHFVLFRFVVNCCAADARPVGILIDTRGRKAPPKDQWYRIVGTVEATEVEGKPAHVIRAKEMQRIGRPKEPYLYGY